jgi:hypothetical protein
MKKGFQPKLNLYKDKEGNIISEESQILKTWVEYYSKTSLIRSDRDQKIGLRIMWFRIIQFFYSGLAYRVFRWSIDVNVWINTYFW